MTKMKTKLRIVLTVVGSLSGVLASHGCDDPPLPGPPPPAPAITVASPVLRCGVAELTRAVGYEVSFSHNPGASDFHDAININGGTTLREPLPRPLSFVPHRGNNFILAVARDDKGVTASSLGVEVKVLQNSDSRETRTQVLAEGDLGCENGFVVEDDVRPGDVTPGMFVVDGELDFLLDDEIGDPELDVFHDRHEVHDGEALEGHWEVRYPEGRLECTGDPQLDPPAQHVVLSAVVACP